MGHFEFFFKVWNIIHVDIFSTIFFQKNLHLFTLINIFVLIYTLGKCIHLHSFTQLKMDLLIFMFTHSRLGIYIYTTFIFTKFHQNANFFWDVNFTKKKVGILVMMIIGIGLCKLGIKSISDCHSNNYGDMDHLTFLLNGMK
jgi:hypothetical protein